MKCENLQVTGSFKTRGAVNRVLALSDDEVQRGIITASGGNHGLGVTYAAGLRGVTPTVYVPLRADESRRVRLRRWGAHVVAEGKDWDDAYAAASARGNETGATLIHPFDDPWVIAGQGTIGTAVRDPSGPVISGAPGASGGASALVATAAMITGQPGSTVAAAAPFTETEIVGAALS